ncbi:arylsulfatase J isoform X1 [Heterodontus francisci]|uniref:arylsulfatase J isoform X1 n=1 Tax=Heterodontus francisci TaxID=7792 RepID=UPI00355B35F4
MISALAGFSVASLLTFGYLSWDWLEPELTNPGLQDSLINPSKPHIIFILADDQGFHDVGYHGSEIHTPTLDRLAAQGVKLENYYIQPICTPSRSQLITGRLNIKASIALDVLILYQIHTGLQHSIIRAGQPNCIPLANVTLPQKLQEAGYSTHMIGKWHLGFYKKECLPTRKGFDTFFGSLTGSGDYYTHEICDGPKSCGYDLHKDENVAWEYRAHSYSTYLYTQKVVELLASHNPKEPIFLYIAFQAVHTPLQVPKKYLGRYMSINNIGRRRYAAMVTCLDEAVNNITRALKKYGYYDNSVIIYSSDNGGQPLAGGSNWPLRGRKGTYWEGGIRGIGFVHSPLIKNKGSVSRGLMHITDWYPTLVTLAEGELEENLDLDGYDIWETISEGKPSPRTDILHNIDPLYTRVKTRSPHDGFGIWDTAIQAAIRVRDWKLLTGNPGFSDWIPPQTFPNFGGKWWNLERVLWAKGKSVWLFNITADPYERVDLSQQYPEVVKKLLLRLAKYNKTAVPVKYPPKDPRCNPNLNGGAWIPWDNGDEEENNLINSNAEEKSCNICNAVLRFKKPVWG